MALKNENRVALFAQIVVTSYILTLKYDPIFLEMRQTKPKYHNGFCLFVLYSYRFYQDSNAPVFIMIYTMGSEELAFD